jgi:hypothetical protein
MDTNFVLYGISLGGLVFGLIKMAGEVGLVGRWADLARGLGLGVAFLLVSNAEALAAQFAWFETAIIQGGGFLTVLLLSMGYGPAITRAANAVANRIQGVPSNLWRNR